MSEAVPHVGAKATEALAPAWRALRGLPATDPWLWLVRPGSLEAAAAIGLVLLDGLPRVLVALGWEVLRRG
ncbi:MAG: hypothetical protein K2Y40_12235 [Reyranella sp.]|nr:hypothetical protein [Reyranella sp.]